MARVIDSNFKTNIGFKIVTIYKDGTSESTDPFFVNDRVENLKYVENKEVATITGRVDAIRTSLIAPYGKYPAFSTAKELIDITGIIVDSSEKEQSKITFISAREVLEPKVAEGKEVKRVVVEPVVKVNGSVKLSDETESTFVIEEHDVLKDVTLFVPGIETEPVTDVRVDKFIFNVKNTRSTEFDVTGVAEVTGKTISKMIDFNKIKLVGGKLELVAEDVKLADIVTTDGAVLPAVSYSEKVSVEKPFTLYGANAGVPATTGKRATNEIDASETVLNETITFTKDADVVIDGLTFTDNARVAVNGGKKITFKNCKFVSATPYQAKSYLVMATAKSTEPVKVECIGCYFGDNAETETGKCYNLIEGNFVWADGSVIKDCYFSKKSCTHNQINIYEVEDGATITIENNHFEYSANAVRVGTKGDANCTINLIGNSYDETDSDPAWAGILLVQPYGKATTNMSNVKINIDKTDAKCGGQLCYLYMGSADTQLTDEQKPKIKIDGKDFF